MYVLAIGILILLTCIVLTIVYRKDVKISASTLTTAFVTCIVTGVYAYYITHRKLVNIDYSVEPAGPYPKEGYLSYIRKNMEDLEYELNYTTLLGTEKHKINAYHIHNTLTRNIGLLNTYKDTIEDSKRDSDIRDRAYINMINDAWEPLRTYYLQSIGTSYSPNK